MPFSRSYNLANTMPRPRISAASLYHVCRPCVHIHHLACAYMVYFGSNALGRRRHRAARACNRRGCSRAPQRTREQRRAALVAACTARVSSTFCRALCRSWRGAHAFCMTAIPRYAGGVSRQRYRSPCSYRNDAPACMRARASPYGRCSVSVADALATIAARRIPLTFCDAAYLLSKQRDMARAAAHCAAAATRRCSHLPRLCRSPRHNLHTLLCARNNLAARNRSRVPRA